jgi:phage-related tail protein
LPNIAHQLKVSVDASVRAALTGQQDALRAELSELKRMVMSSQTVAAPQLGEIQRSLAAMGERVEALQKSVTALSEQLGAVKEAMPRPLVEQTRDVVARLRGRTR